VFHRSFDQTVRFEPTAVLENRPLLARALRPVLALVGVVIASIVGFVLLAGVGIVEAAYWLISPAGVGLHFRDAPGSGTTTKAFAVLSRVGFVIVGLWIGQTVVSALFKGQISEEVTRVQQERKIADLSGHVIVCGYGMFGRTIASRLDTDEHPVVVIEADDNEVKRAEEDGLLVVDGDARMEATLNRAGIDRASTVIAAVDDSNVNIQICILADQLATEAKIVVRVGTQMYATTAQRAGADSVVIPEIMSGNDVADDLSFVVDDRSV